MAINKELIDLPEFWKKSSFNDNYSVSTKGRVRNDTKKKENYLKTKY